MKTLKLLGLSALPVLAVGLTYQTSSAKPADPTLLKVAVPGQTADLSATIDHQMHDWAQDQRAHLKPTAAPVAVSDSALNF